MGCLPRNLAPGREELFPVTDPTYDGMLGYSGQTCVKLGETITLGENFAPVWTDTCYTTGLWVYGIVNASTGTNNVLSFAFEAPINASGYPGTTGSWNTITYWYPHLNNHPPGEYYLARYSPDNQTSWRFYDTHKIFLYDPKVEDTFSAQDTFEYDHRGGFIENTPREDLYVEEEVGIRYVHFSIHQPNSSSRYEPGETVDIHVEIAQLNEINSELFGVQFLYTTIINDPNEPVGYSDRNYISVAFQGYIPGTDLSHFTWTIPNNIERGSNIRLWVIAKWDNVQYWNSAAYDATDYFTISKGWLENVPADSLHFSEEVLHVHKEMPRLSTTSDVGESDSFEIEIRPVQNYLYSLGDSFSLLDSDPNLYDHRIAHRFDVDGTDQWVGINESYFSYLSEHHEKNTTDTINIYEPTLFGNPIYLSKVMPRKNVDDDLGFQEGLEFDFGDVAHYSEEALDNFGEIDTFEYLHNTQYLHNTEDSLTTYTSVSEYVYGHQKSTTDQIKFQENVEHVHYGITLESVPSLVGAAVEKGNSIWFYVTKRGDLAGSGNHIRLDYGVPGATMTEIGVLTADPDPQFLWYIPLDTANLTGQYVTASISTSSYYTDGPHALTGAFLIRSEYEKSSTTDVLSEDLINFYRSERRLYDIGDSIYFKEEVESFLKVMPRISVQESFSIGDDNGNFYYLSDHKTENVGEEVVRFAEAVLSDHKVMKRVPTTVSVGSSDSLEYTPGLFNHFTENPWSRLGIIESEPEYFRSRPYDVEATSEVNFKESVDSDLASHTDFTLNKGVGFDEDIGHKQWIPRHIYTFSDDSYITDYTEKWQSQRHIENTTDSLRVYTSDIPSFHVHHNRTGTALDEFSGVDTFIFDIRRARRYETSDSIYISHTVNDDSVFGEGSDLEYFHQGYSFKTGQEAGLPENLWGSVAITGAILDKDDWVRILIDNRSNYGMNISTGEVTLYYQIGGDGSTFAMDGIIYTLVNQNSVTWVPVGMSGFPVPAGSTIITECSDEYRIWIVGDKGPNDGGRGQWQAGFMSIAGRHVFETTDSLGFAEDHEAFYPLNHWYKNTTDELAVTFSSEDVVLEYRSHQLGPFIADSDIGFAETVSHGQGHSESATTDVGETDQIAFVYTLHFVKNIPDEQFGLTDPMLSIFDDNQNLSMYAQSDVSEVDTINIAQGHVRSDLDHSVGISESPESYYGFVRNSEISKLSFSEDVQEIHWEASHIKDVTLDSIYLEEDVLHFHGIQHVINTTDQFGFDDDSDSIYSHKVSVSVDNVSSVDTFRYVVQGVDYEAPTEGQTYYRGESLYVRFGIRAHSSETIVRVQNSFYYWYDLNDYNAKTLIASNNGSPGTTLQYDWSIPEDTVLSENAKVFMLTYTIFDTPEGQDYTMQEVYTSDTFIMKGSKITKEVIHNFVDFSEDVHYTKILKRKCQSDVGADDSFAFVHKIMHRHNIPFEKFGLADDTSDRGIGIDIYQPTYYQKYYIYVHPYHDVMSILYGIRWRNMVSEPVRLIYSPSGEYDAPENMFLGENPPGPNSNFQTFLWDIPNVLRTIKTPRIFIATKETWRFYIEESFSLRDKVGPDRARSEIGFSESVSSHKGGPQPIVNIGDGVSIYDLTPEFDHRRLEFGILDVVELDDGSILFGGTWE